MSNYDLLGVSKDASLEEIRKAYHRKIKQYHPDAYQGDADFAREKTQDLVSAYREITQRIELTEADLNAADTYRATEDFYDEAEEDWEPYVDPEDEPFNIWEEVHWQAERAEKRVREREERVKKSRRNGVSPADIVFQNRLLIGILATIVFLVVLIADLVHVYRQPADLQGLYFTQVQQESGVQNLYIHFVPESGAKGTMYMYVMNQDAEKTTYRYSFSYEAWNRKSKTLFSKLEQHLAPAGDGDVRYAKISFQDGSCVGLDQNVHPLDVSGRDTADFDDVCEYDGSRIYFQGIELDLVDHFYEADNVARSLLDHYEEAVQ